MGCPLLLGTVLLSCDDLLPELDMSSTDDLAQLPVYLSPNHPLTCNVTVNMSLSLSQSAVLHHTFSVAL